MRRRAFLRAAAALAASPALPALPAVAAPAAVACGVAYGTAQVALVTAEQELINFLARGMLETKERIAADILNRAFEGYEL